MSKSFYLLMASVMALGSVFVLTSFFNTVNHPSAAALAVESGSIYAAALLLAVSAFMLHSRKVF